MQYTEFWRKIVGFMFWQIYSPLKKLQVPVAYPGILFYFFFLGGGVQQIQLRTKDRENGDMGVIAPYSGVLEAANIWYKKFHFI